MAKISQIQATESTFITQGLSLNLKRNSIQAWIEINPWILSLERDK